MVFSVTTQQDGYNLSADVNFIGEDILISVYGGDKPHIGAVAASQPRPSLKDEEATSASTSVICFVGHKEDELAKYIAGKVATEFNVRTVVCAGAHWDDITEKGIQRVGQSAKQLAVLLLDRIHLSDR